MDGKASQQDQDQQTRHLPIASGATRSAAADAARCSMLDVLHWSGCEWPSLHGRGAESLPLRPLRAGDMLVHQHQVLDAFYMVSAGCLKLFTVDEDGFEQVTGFAFRGDVVGLDACYTGFHAASAMALDEASVTPLARWAALRELKVQPNTQQLLQCAAARELQRRAETQYLMAPASAEVRVARFLIQYGQRQREMGFSPRRFRLAMGRRDMASYLGLAHETVSRSFTLLAHGGYLRVEQREVEILDVEQLATMAHATRGPSAVAALKRKARSLSGHRPAPLALVA